MGPKQSWLVIISVFAFVLIGAVIASFFVRGYRPDLKKGILAPTGLLAATSVPKGASVYINNKLVTATDDTLNLSPDQYQVKIIKDGFLPWGKTITIKKEIVKQTEAHLFRAAPDLKPITTTGAQNPVLSPDGYRLVYAVSSASAAIKNGLWVSELGSNGLNLIRSSSKQIARHQPGLDWSQAEFTWSPDNQNILVQFKKEEKIMAAYLLPVDRLTLADQLRDVSFQLQALLPQWEEQRQKELADQISLLPKEMQKVASSSATMVTFSPNEERFFYLATQETEIAENLIPHPPARSDQKEERKIKPGRMYVYDLKEDTNFFIIEAEKVDSLHWLATSRHLVFVEEDKIKVIEADGTNKQTLYAGPFIDHFVVPWPNGTKLVILTSLHSDLPPNLYAITIK